MSVYIYIYVSVCLCVCVYVCVQQKTRAAHRLVDDVSDDVKRRRHDELAKTFRLCAHQLNQSLIGQRRVVLVDRVSHSVSQSVIQSVTQLSTVERLMLSMLLAELIDSS